MMSCRPTSEPLGRTTRRSAQHASANVSASSAVGGGEASLDGLVALLLGPALGLARVDDLAVERREVVLELIGELGGGDHVAGEA